MDISSKQKLLCYVDKLSIKILIGDIGLCSFSFREKVCLVRFLVPKAYDVGLFVYTG